MSLIQPGSAYSTRWIHTFIHTYIYSPGMCICICRWICSTQQMWAAVRCRGCGCGPCTQRVQTTVYSSRSGLTPSSHKYYACVYVRTVLYIYCNTVCMCLVYINVSMYICMYVCVDERWLFGIAGHTICFSPGVEVLPAALSGPLGAGLPLQYYSRPVREAVLPGMSGVEEYWPNPYNDNSSGILVNGN